MESVTVLQLISEYISKNKVLFVIYCITVIALPLNEVILPHFYGRLIANLQRKEVRTSLIWIIVGLLVVVQVLNIISDIVDVKLFTNMHEFVRTFCVDFIVGENSKNLKEIKIGQVLSKIIRLPFTLYNFIDDWRTSLIPSFITYIGVIIYLSFFDLLLPLLMFILTAVITYFTYKAFTSCLATSKSRDAYHNLIFEEVDEIFRNIVSILTNNTYEHEKDRIQTLQKKYNMYSFATLWCTNKYKLIFLILQITVMTLFVLRMIVLYKSKRIELAHCISIFIIMLYLNNTMLRHTYLFKEVAVRYGVLKEALSLFKYTKEPVIESGELGLIPDEYCLVVSNIEFSHNTNKLIDGFNLAIRCRENVALVGEIGCGKSTLLKLILRYYAPTHGEIYLYGVPYHKMTREEVRKKIGYISQNPILFNRTLRENISYGTNGATDEDIWRVIRKMNLESHFSRYENGLDTMAGKNGSNLSGGEKQIIYILRILLQNPDIILMDEPTSAMDENTRDTVFKLLIDIMHEKTVIAVTHDKDLLKHFHRVVNM